MGFFVAKADLTVRVEAPRVKFTSLCQSNSVTKTSRACLDVSGLRELDLSWCSNFTEPSKTKLTHLCLSPTEHFTLIGYSKRVVCTCSDG